jgi:hypothetical protein
MQLQELNWADTLSNGFKGMSGKTYRMESELSVTRYAKLQEYLIEVSTGRNAADFIKKVQEAYDLLQQPRIMDAGEKLREVLYGSKNITTKPHPVQKAVAMFFNAEDETLEERLVFDESKMIAKIEDWRGYGLKGFFPLLMSMADGLKLNSSENLDGIMR